jgi:hypothetical protein
MTRKLSQALIGAMDKSGDKDGKGKAVGYLAWLSKARPELFVAMISRLLPVKVEAPLDEDLDPRRYLSHDEIRAELEARGLPTTIFTPIQYDRVEYTDKDK